jgi:transcriptional regulator with XRE-family HTH domain
MMTYNAPNRIKGKGGPRAGAGRPPGDKETGPGYELAMWIDARIDDLLASRGWQANDLTSRLGYQKPNILSQWRSGRSRIPIEKLVQLSGLFNIDLAPLLRMWLEQYIGTHEDAPALLGVFDRFVNEEELEIVKAHRAASAKGKTV